jgi:integrase/recombinase XerD
MTKLETAVAAMTKLETAVAESKDLRPRTKELYLQHVRAFLTFAKSRPWTPQLVIRWRNNMRKRHIKPQSVNVALNALRFAAQQANLEFFTDDVKRLPIRAKTAKAVASAAKRALDWDEGCRLVAVCAGERGRDLRDCALITLGLRTGMLRFSMCKLKIENVTDSGFMTFEKKGGERHAVMLDDVTRQALRAWIDWLTEHDVTDGMLFRSLGRQRVGRASVAVGKQLTPDGLYRALRERAWEAGFEDLRPHVFRETFLAWAKRAGAKPGQIAAVTGHKSDAVGDDSGVTTPPANMLLPTWKKGFK